MARVRRPHSRCPRCLQRLADCLCPGLPCLELRTHLVLVTHFRELPSPSNSGRLATLTLKHSELRVRGLKDAGFDKVGLIGEQRAGWLLFPTAGAEVLGPELVARESRPVTLVVPDGSWRQARKIVKREPALAALRPVTLPEAAPSRYRLRRAPQPGCLSTLEAIARALGVLEGAEVQARLETVFDEMVARIERGRPYARDDEAS